MLVYRYDVCAWNGVDVLVDGQLQHGHVMNVIDDGLFVNFGCRAEFIRYGNVFECRQATDHPNVKHRPPSHWSAGEKAQVLLRAAPGAPWIWYPGTIVALDDYCQDDAVLVDVQLPGRIIRELLLCQQVRVPLSEEDLAQRRIVDKHFVIRCCPLPDGYAAEASPHLTWHFQNGVHEDEDVVCTGEFSQYLLYLQCRTATPLEAETLCKVYAATKNDLDPIFPVQPLSNEVALPPNKKRKTDALPRRNLPLPVELLLEVFRSLDSVGRVRCRRVSELWNRLLTTEAYFPEVRVSGRKADAPDELDENQWVVACLLKCVTCRTRTVAVLHLHFPQSLRAAALIGHTRQAARLPTLVFYRCEWGDDWSGEYIGAYLKDMVKLWADAERVVWKQCRIYDHHLQAVISRQALSVQPDAVLEAQLWDLFEKYLALKKLPDLPALAHWIANCISNKRRKQIKTELIKVRMCRKPLNVVPGTYYS
ncbi:uncharacterized protein LOC129600245 [Paramacrobiotus metropolitanus]|uniref:uncharacterized protein LOC129600245 n=1 Tax=Paramacrobiotus metropolitanus TaxID=2943436 RepID=UPI002445FA7F|nr:uncharacterized protein LOC129600245 [Paramacrobiotus metropolitanus]